MHNLVYQGTSIFVRSRVSNPHIETFFSLVDHTTGLPQENAMKAANKT